MIAFSFLGIPDVQGKASMMRKRNKFDLLCQANESVFGFALHKLIKVIQIRLLT